MKKTLLTVLGVTATAVALAAPASASPLQAVTVVDWGGTDCLSFHTQNVADPYEESGEAVQCSEGHELTFMDQATSGEVIGVDPVMEGNDWISCTITINGGQHVFHSYAARGDGNDVNCLRTVD